MGHVEKLIPAAQRGLAFLVLPCLLLGCSAQVTVGKVSGRALGPESWEFQDAVRTFKITPAEAAEIVRDAEQKPDAPNSAVSAIPQAVIGRYYLFDSWRLFFLPLEGYYVNGDTGELLYYEDPRVLRLGPFNSLYVDKWR